MRILILGAGGMLGHQIFHRLNQEPDLSVVGLVRKPVKHYWNTSLYTDSRALIVGDVSDLPLLEKQIQLLRPKVIVNCIGLTTRKINSLSNLIAINSHLPHWLSEKSKDIGSRLIHFSTDCVFSGKLPAGEKYKEDAITDAKDPYGKSKALGEVTDSHCLTLRSSIIGFEIDHKTELVEWFLAQAGKKTKGFSEVYYTGVTTPFMADLVANAILKFPKLSGLYQVATEPISKFELLSLLNSMTGNKVILEKDSNPVSNKCLDGSRFVRDTGIQTPSWTQQLEKMTSIFNSQVIGRAS